MDTNEKYFDNAKLKKIRDRRYKMATQISIDWKSECQGKLEENLRQCESRLQEYFCDEDNRSWWINRARQICDAIERIKQGTYGLCTNCKQLIGRERLLAFPIAQLCIDCQTRIENNNMWLHTNTVATGGFL